MTVRVVVGGQVPPPMSGQHLSVAQALARLGTDDRMVVEHLPYRFAAHMQEQGRLAIRKVAELLRLVVAVLACRRHGPVDVFLHPVSGPGTAPAVKDAIVVTAARVVSRHVVLQFHGGGHAHAWATPTRLQRLLRRALGRADLGVVHARIHEQDPISLGIPRVAVVPHRIPDRFDPQLRDASASPGPVRVLYVGHLGPHRGTPELLRAVVSLQGEGLAVQLVLVGEPAQGWTGQQLADLLADLPPGVVDHHPVAVGRELDGLFAGADVFAFPSRFAAESFGLVLVEALMWGLPVVATDWGAASEVLAGDDLDVVLHPTGPSLEDELVAALRPQVTGVVEGTRPAFSAANRQAYERRYRDDVYPLADVLVELAGG